MRITKVEIPKSADGIDQIKMDKLGKVVLIAGKNGSGKTRILNKIFGAFNTKPVKQVIDNAKTHLEQGMNQLADRDRAITNFTEILSKEKDNVRIEAINKAISDEIRSREMTLKVIAQCETVLGWKQIETSEIGDSYVAVRFVPKILKLHDCSALPRKEITSYAASINSVGVESLPQGSFAKIQVIQDRWFSSTHQNSQVPEKEKLKAIEDYEKLTKIVGVFLGTSIGRNIDDEPTLFGLPMGQSNLSDGQRILLQFCLAIYSQETALKDLILILDEPENHLHPSVIIETIERIQQCVFEGQIWIATHSVPLLAHFDPSLIWYVEDGKIEHAGKIPEKVLQSLLGDENEIARLQDFISLPAQFATSRYAFECLLDPGVVMTDGKDPQSSQVRTDLLNLVSAGKLRVLEFGAGKGRLISNIVDLDEANHEKLVEKIDYVAYDKYPTDKEYCENALSKAYGNSERRYFNDMGQLLSVYDKESFDVVVMCNVLHEIDPKDWLKLFRADGMISNLLSENGVLLLVEDHQIPVGEKAYQKGFLVLDTPQLKELFKITERDIDFSFSQKKEGRLKAHRIPKRLLMQVDEKSRLAAIKSLSNTAREKIIEIREMKKNYQNGKLHGFWTQQFANAQLNIAEFTGE
ncbi:AAA family ATPase [Fulvivirgaceae bacterium PWU4]|uniref:AAA family ATPase n=1 Tax=Chryseosolibacter histidini TaxID=2782349 RepID=A0AAP2DKA0_9BACT|nr:AAA family ATPase [Chryseosolibacter histidini]MBT1697895.1 AAA family ATPase [Chryseosolibacter histidini]